MTIGLYLHYVEQFRCRKPIGVLLSYWLLSSVGLIYCVYQLYVDGAYHDHAASLYTVSYTLAAVNAFVVLCVEWLAPKYVSDKYIALGDEDAEEELSPYEQADLFSRVTFAWMTPLMRLGYSKYLTEKDLSPLPKTLKTEVTADSFDEAWQAQVESKNSPSFSLALAYAYGKPFLLGGFFKAIQDALQFTQPQLLRVLIQFVNDYYARPDEVPLSRGFTIAVAMFLVSALQTAALHQYFQHAFETGMRIKSGLTAAIFRKALVLSNEDRAGKSTGDIVNLMSVDTQRLQDLSQYGQTIWSGPFQIILCLISLHGILGNSMWAGVFVMVVMIPVNSFLASKQKGYQQRQMKNKDERTRLTSELFTNIKSIKLYGWEVPFTKRLSDVRTNKELNTLRDIGVLNAFVTFIWNSAPFMVSCSTFALFVYMEDRPLTSDIVFPALSLFNLLGFPLAVIPNVISSLIEASVAVSRIKSFLTGEELQPDAVRRLPPAEEEGETAVEINDATFLWHRKPQYKIALEKVNFAARKGELSCVVGRVGSGKSSLLQAILGDLYKLNGDVSVKGSVAYVAQVPWIMNATVKENILFGHKYEPEFYQETIRACALLDDFAILPKGDDTIVGEKGISLSGGQKARLSLARAVYARADVYLLDDPLSAVDEHVGRHIIDNVLGEEGLLSSKCIVLATNSIPVLSHASYITMVDNGSIVDCGPFNEVIASKGPIQALLNEFGRKKKSSSSKGDASETATVVDETSENGDSLTPGTRSASASMTDIVTLTAGDKPPLPRSRRRRSLRRASAASFAHPTADDEREEENKEHAEQGKVKWDVYLEYAKASNFYGVIAYLVLLVLSQGLNVSGNVWLKHWSEVNTGSGSNPHVGRYLGIYAAFGIGACVIIVAQTLILMVYCAIHGAKLLHDRMLQSVIRAPMSFFETTPLGRIINRFSNDVYRVDQVLARTFSMFFGNATKVMYTLLVISVSTPAFLVIVLPLTALYLYYQRYYLRTSRELKRLDSVSKSPIYAHFQETLGGISTVRAYDQSARFNYINSSRVDLNQRAYYPTISANRWLAVRLELIGGVIIFTSAALAVASLPSRALSAGAVGLALSYALQITQSLNWIVRMTVEVETNIVSVERILEYAELTPEAAPVVEGHRPPAHWPHDGAIAFKDYSTRYRPGLPLVLKNINLDIKPREKIGIVGRTGAGKSSLTLALFRIIEAADGEIDIDSVRTSAIGLADLRQKLSIIPQDSQVFEGTIRENIDPMNRYDDTELWRALELSHLKDHISEMEAGLESRITEGGSNLSVGQRQLMCLARALLNESNVLVLDEATAAVDVKTDQVIQQTIRSQFAQKTILTIAHRINTIMDSDRIVVLDNGHIAEFDSPQNLIANKNSHFRSLAKQAGLVDEDDD